MFLKKIDFWTPPITLFTEGHDSHSSCLSGILSLITLAVIILFSVFQIKNLFNRDDETPTSTSFKYFKYDAGKISLNDSSLFHFISFQDFKNKNNKKFDFSYFNIIGIEQPISTYETNNDIKNYNHWLYGYCNDERIKGIENIEKIDYLTKSACIKKYYDKETNQYYEISDAKFKYPSISHGTFNHDNTVYSILFISCTQTFLDIEFNGKLSCKNIDEVYISSIAVHLNFIDEYIDVLNYDNPIVKYLFRIENKLDNDNYSINHLNFNPSAIRSNIL